MEWHKDGSKWTLHHTWKTGITDIPSVEVRFVDHCGEKLIIMILEDGVKWREVFCRKQSRFPDPMATFDCNDGKHAIEVRLSIPGDMLNDNQTLKLFVDGKDMDGEHDVSATAERTIAEILAAAGLQKCIAAFIFENITTENELRELTDEQMKELGVTKMGDRIRLRSQITSRQAQALQMEREREQQRLQVLREERERQQRLVKEEQRRIHAEREWEQQRLAEAEQRRIQAENEREQQRLAEAEQRRIQAEREHQRSVEDTAREVQTDNLERANNLQKDMKRAFYQGLAREAAGTLFGMMI